MNKTLQIVLAIAVLTTVVAGGVLVAKNSRKNNTTPVAQSSNSEKTEESSESKKPYEVDTGIVATEQTVGSGDEATDDMIVTIDFTATLADGTVFEDTYKTGEPERFVLGYGKVIEGLDKGVVGMKVGGKRQLVIQPEQAYGQSGSKKLQVPGGSVVTYIIELKKVEPAED